MSSVYEQSLSMGWQNFTKSVRDLIEAVQDNDADVASFIPMIEPTFKLVDSREFSEVLDGAWRAFGRPRYDQIGDVLLLEFSSFTEAAASASTTDSVGEKLRKTRFVLGKAPVVTGSLRDLVENLPAWAKMALTLFEELIDLFR